MHTKKDFEFLLLCLREDVGKAAFSDSTPVKWGNIIRLAIKQGVAPILYQRLVSTGSAPDIPRGILQSLHGVYLKNAARNMVLFRQFAEIFRILKGGGIPFIVLKGAHLAEVVYGDTALRPMADLDILVEKEDLSKANDKLTAFGYRPLPDLKEKEDSLHLPRLLKKGAPPVEIHWRIHSPSFSKLDIAVIWEKARMATVAGVDVLVLCPDHLLLHLCMHASLHGFRFGLGPVCDIQRTLDYYRDDIDWEEAVRLARRWGTDKSLYVALRLAKEMLGITPPDGVLMTLRPKDAQQIMALIREQAIADSPPNFTRLIKARRAGDILMILLRGAIPDHRRPAGGRRTASGAFFPYVLHIKDILSRNLPLVRDLLRNGQAAIALSDLERENALNEWFSTNAGRRPQTGQYSGFSVQVSGKKNPRIQGGSPNPTVGRTKAQNGYLQR